MRIAFVFFSICCLILSFMFVCAKYDHPPLALSISKDYYKLANYEDVKRKANDIGKDSSKTFEASVLCCAAETKEEENFNKQMGSPFHYFVKKVNLNENELQSEFHCRDKYQPSIQTSQTPVLSFIPKAVAASKDLVVYKSGYKVCDLEERLKIDKLPALKDKNCDFFHAMKILFDNEKRSPRQVRYELMDVPDGEAEKFVVCLHFDVGSHLIDIDMKKAYEHSNQDEIFNDMVSLQMTQFTVKFERIVPQDESHSKLETLQCNLTIPGAVEKRIDKPENERDYLMLQPLAPAQHFRVESLQMATCSHMNTTPMWPSSIRALSRVQTFIRKLANQIGKINVIAGTHGVFKYASMADESCEPKEMQYLLGDKISISELFYTVVVHHLFDDESKKTHDFGIILITPNGIWFDDPSSYCDIINCSDVGFGMINRTDEISKTACCVFNNNNLNKLNISYEEGSEKHGLNLSSSYVNWKAFKNGDSENIAERITML